MYDKSIKRSRKVSLGIMGSQSSNIPLSQKGYENVLTAFWSFRTGTKTSKARREAVDNRAFYCRIKCDKHLVCDQFHLQRR